MKVAHLLEAKVSPDWVKAEDAAFKALVKRYGLTYTKRPSTIGTDWVFGGQLQDAPTSDLSISLDKRVAGLQKAVARHLFDLKEQGRDVLTYDTRWLGPYWLGPTSHDRRPLRPDDSLAYVEQRVKDRLFINTIAGGGYTIAFQYGVSEPRPEEPKPVEPERKVYRVVKGFK